jgi:hypothetical protein
MFTASCLNRFPGAADAADTLTWENDAEKTIGTFGGPDKRWPRRGALTAEA